MAIKELTLNEELALKPIWFAESIDRGSGDTHQGVTVEVDITGATAVTAVDPASQVVDEGGSAVFTLTFAEDKTADDIQVSAGEVTGTTLTVPNVTEDTTVEITDVE